MQPTRRRLPRATTEGGHWFGFGRSKLSQHSSPVDSVRGTVCKGKHMMPDARDTFHPRPQVGR